MRQDFPLLRSGDRYIENGQLYEISRVTPCAAYPFKVYEPPKLVVFTDKKGVEHRVMASRGQVESGISIRSAVKLIKEADSGSGSGHSNVGSGDRVDDGSDLLPSDSQALVE